MIPPRTTTDLVQGILGGNYGTDANGNLPDLDPFIATASIPGYRRTNPRKLVESSLAAEAPPLTLSRLVLESTKAVATRPFK